MSSYAAPVEVVNSALAEMVDTQIESLLDGSPAALVANVRYEPIVRKELTQHAWSWAKKVSRLTYQGETGNSPAYAYYLPGDLLLPRQVRVGSVPVTSGIELRSNKMLVNVQRDYDLHYTWRAPESEWPADFSEAIQRRMLAVLLRALPVDYARAREMDQEAEDWLMRARIRDRTAQGRPTTTVDPILVRAWRGNSPHAQA